MLLQLRRHRFNPWAGKIPWKRKWQPTPVFFSWEIPWTDKPSGLQSTGLQRVRRNSVTEHKHTIPRPGIEPRPLAVEAGSSQLRPKTNVKVS